MTDIQNLQKRLRENPCIWLVTGVAGFIGSHLAESLLDLGQVVRGLDDLSSGHLKNIGSFAAHKNFTFIKGDICDEVLCREACAGIHYVLHHAAIGSVVKSLENPALVDRVNNGGFLNILVAAREAGVRRVVYASSSAVYGEGSLAARHEGERPQPLSPYAVTKCANELYATVTAQTCKLETAGLRYFNIYGARQDPEGAYAAVIPKWIGAMTRGEPIEIYGDGETIRDFCFIGDVAQANIRAALSVQNTENPVYNIAGGVAVTLNDLFAQLKTLTGYDADPVYKDFRAADIRVSRADISKARQELGFAPAVALEAGLRRTVEWYRV
ncbi:MAG: LPS biosynthesis protein WbpP [Alphaproteobacteria bacterium CG_4_9_14_3_um_filter_47_13]|nr:MAG: LPS biosynthesis protein WbpP [Alphaproteobacteria bacterium CG_4_9_14_3_um_filter_47_13]